MICFTSAPILRHFENELQCVIECNASDLTICRIKSQKVEERLHPVAFHASIINQHEINNEIDSKELLVIFSKSKQCRGYINGARHTINKYTDHEGLKPFANNKPLNHRQARWDLGLDGFDFQIFHYPGVKNGKPDTLSRCSVFRPEKGGEGYLPVKCILKPGKYIQNDFSENTKVIVSSVIIQGICPIFKLSNDLEMGIVKKAVHDLFLLEEYERACESHAVNSEVLVVITYKDNLHYHKGKIWLTCDKVRKKMVFENQYNTIVAGYMGMDKTLEMVNCNFYCLRMGEDIANYVRSSDDCLKNKASHHKRHGTLHPLEWS